MGPIFSRHADTFKNLQCPEPPAVSVVRLPVRVCAASSINGVFVARDAESARVLSVAVTATHRVIPGEGLAASLFVAGLEKVPPDHAASFEVPLSREGGLLPGDLHALDTLFATIAIESLRSRCVARRTPDAWIDSFERQVKRGDNLTRALVSSGGYKYLGAPMLETIWREEGFIGQTALNALIFAEDPGFLAIRDRIDNWPGDYNGDLFQLSAAQKRHLLALERKGVTARKDISAVLEKRGSGWRADKSLDGLPNKGRTDWMSGALAKVLQPQTVKVRGGKDGDIARWRTSAAPPNLDMPSLIRVFQQSAVGRAVDAIAAELVCKSADIRQARTAMEPSLARARHELAEKIMSSLPPMPARYFRTIYLYLAADLSLTEIAETLESSGTDIGENSLNAPKQSVHRILTKYLFRHAKSLGTWHK